MERLKNEVSGMNTYGDMRNNQLGGRLNSCITNDYPEDGVAGYFSDLGYTGGVTSTLEQLRKIFFKGNTCPGSLSSRYDDFCPVGPCDIDNCKNVFTRIKSLFDLVKDGQPCLVYTNGFGLEFEVKPIFDDIAVLREKLGVFYEEAQYFDADCNPPAPTTPAPLPRCIRDSADYWYVYNLFDWYDRVESFFASTDMFPGTYKTCIINAFSKGRDYAPTIDEFRQTFTSNSGICGNSNCNVVFNKIKEVIDTVANAPPCSLPDSNGVDYRQRYAELQPKVLTAAKGGAAWEFAKEFAIVCEPKTS
jgi:hypothetical protein